MVGPWIAGIDFPFGQSRKFIENVGWPQEWEIYAEMLNTMTREDLCDLLNKYKADFTLLLTKFYTTLLH